MLSYVNYCLKQTSSMSITIVSVRKLSATSRCTTFPRLWAVLKMTSLISLRKIDVVVTFFGFDLSVLLCAIHNAFLLHCDANEVTHPIAHFLKREREVRNIKMEFDLHRYFTHLMVCQGFLLESFLKRALFTINPLLFEMSCWEIAASSSSQKRVTLSGRLSDSELARISSSLSCFDNELKDVPHGVRFKASNDDRTSFV